MNDRPRLARALVPGIVALLLAMNLSLAGPQAPQNPKEPEQGQSASPATEDSGAGKPKSTESSESSTTPGAQGPANTSVAILTVVVTAEGEPVDKAEVRMVVRPEDEQLPPRYTNARGEVTLSSSTLGKAKVRVLAKQWQSTLREVTLVAGPQTLRVSLKPLP